MQGLAQSFHRDQSKGEFVPPRRRIVSLLLSNFLTIQFNSYCCAIFSFFSAASHGAATSASFSASHIHSALLSPPAAWSRVHLPLPSSAIAGASTTIFTKPKSHSQSQKNKSIVSNRLVRTSPQRPIAKFSRMRRRLQIESTHAPLAWSSHPSLSARDSGPVLADTLLWMGHAVSSARARQGDRTSSALDLAAYHDHRHRVSSSDLHVS